MYLRRRLSHGIKTKGLRLSLGQCAVGNSVFCVYMCADQKNGRVLFEIMHATRVPRKGPVVGRSRLSHTLLSRLVLPTASFVTLIETRRTTPSSSPFGGRVCVCGLHVVFQTSYYDYCMFRCGPRLRRPQMLKFEKSGFFFSIFVLRRLFNFSSFCSRLGASMAKILNMWMLCGMPPPGAMPSPLPVTAAMGYIRVTGGNVVRISILL